jgi:RNA polymerase sigma-70 factor (ECF subfamily)
MLAFQRGELEAFDALFERWATRLLRFLIRMVKDPAVAEELVQETFLRVHRARDRYSPEAKFSTWLYTIAGNAARNELRRPFRRHVHESADEEREGASLELESGAPATDLVVHTRRVGDTVEAALAHLPERQRAALWLCAVEGFSYAEIAETLDTTEKSVKALVHRARVALAKHVTSEGEPVGGSEGGHR